MTRKSSVEQPDNKSTNRSYHEWVLKAAFTKLQESNGIPLIRTELETSICQSHPSSRISQKKRVAEIVRTTINVLLSLNILESLENNFLKFNLKQAKYIENVDHYCHALFLFEEANEKLLQEETNLLNQLINRAAPNTSLKSNSTTAVTTVPTTQNSSSSSSQQPKKKKGRIESPPLEVSRETTPSIVESVPSISSIAQRANRDETVQKIRELQLSMLKPNGRGMIEATLLAHPEKPKFIPSGYGPMGMNQVPNGAKDSKGSAVASPRANNTSSSSHHSFPTGNGDPYGGAQPDAAKGLKPGYEIELRTSSIDFSVIASQFEPWNGQESDTGFSGRLSPRPSPSSSPGLGNDLSWHPSISPSPPPTFQQPAAVRVPQYSVQIDPLVKISNDLSPEELEEEKQLSDATMLNRHDLALADFKVKYERAQED